MISPFTLLLAERLVDTHEGQGLCAELHRANGTQRCEIFQKWSGLLQVPVQDLEAAYLYLIS